jgi:hypothetical protein
MTWGRNVSPGFNKRILNNLNEELLKRRVKKTKLKVCLSFLHLANSSKRMFKRGFKRASYPDTLEYFKLLEKRKKLATTIISITKTIKEAA